MAVGFADGRKNDSDFILFDAEKDGEQGTRVLGWVLGSQTCQDSFPCLVASRVCAPPKMTGRE